ncbi:MAG: UpxY family transcription antiterminator [Candidatus Korobacteraceae bacterium]
MRPQSDHSFADGVGWYAAYTLPRHERAVVEQLARKNIQVFCPMYVVQRKWKDRKVRLQAPLFPGYVFARIALSERVAVITAPGVIRIVSSNGCPVPIPVAEIEAVRLCLTEASKVQPHAILEDGMLVRVRTGPFAGLEGRIARAGNSCKVVVSIAAVHQAIALEVDEACLEPVTQLNLPVPMTSTLARSSV